MDEPKKRHANSATKFPGVSYLIPRDERVLKHLKMVLFTNSSLKDIVALVNFNGKETQWECFIRVKGSIARSQRAHSQPALELPLTSQQNPEARRGLLPSVHCL